MVLALLSLFLLLASLGLALCGAASYNDSYSHDADKAWGVASMAVGGLLFVASCSALLFLLVPKRPIWLVSLVAHGLTLLGDAFVVVQGFHMMADAKRRGGDWGAAAIFGSMVFGIVIPAIIGLAALGNGYLLLRRARLR